MLTQCLFQVRVTFDKHGESLGNEMVLLALAVHLVANGFGRDEAFEDIPSLCEHVVGTLLDSFRILGLVRELLEVFGGLAECLLRLLDCFAGLVQIGAEASSEFIEVDIGVCEGVSL